MIYFNCKKCGKTHSRGEGSGGTTIFCTCGHGNLVPWESTAPAPVETPPPMAGVPKVPDLAPIQFDPVPATSAPGSPSSYPSKPSTYPSKPFLEEDDRPTRRGRNEKRDPDFCFNHQRRPKAQACAECEEQFCVDCLASFQGELYCAPCKNFLARKQEMPPAASTMAMASLLISLIAGPIMMCLLLWSPASNPTHVLSWLSLAPQAMALGLGIWAIREAEKECKGGGQWVAVSGVAIAGMCCVLIVLLNLYAYRVA